MGKINILEPNVFNVIAAGEVVERPASVVKELVENAIDAGATDVEITVANGGIDRIVVSDNGIGILKDDIRAAFLPHATSKLKDISDLDTLSSLGFRGEALASIASVSEITLSSRARGADYATKITLSAGQVTSESVDSRAEGTIIAVENLFFNTPARVKFLKIPSAELKAIIATVEKLCFANPSVAITLKDEHKVLLEQERGELIDSITSVFGADTAEKMLPLEYEKSGIRIGGYTSNSSLTKPSRTWQTFIVNGRAVENKDLTVAVERAYEGRLVKRNYPVCVLDIILPFDEVDVNVHPRKSEVRFRNKNAVFGCIYRAICDALDKETNLFLTFVSKSAADSISNSQDTDAYSANNQNADYVNNQNADSTLREQRVLSGGESGGFIIGGLRNLDMSKHKDNHDSGLNHSLRNAFAFGDSQIGQFAVSANVGSDISNKGKQPTDNPELIQEKMSEYGVRQNAQSARSQEMAATIGDEYFAHSSSFDGKIVGQLFSTYIIVERDGNAYIIDQHAAHERLLYDRLMQHLQNNFAQPLLIPYRFKLSGDEEDYLSKILPTLTALGFEIVKSSDSYLIHSVPQIVAGIDFKVFLGAIFSNMLSDKDITLAEIVKDKLCSAACKAAIKGGDSLTPAQIEATLASLIDKDGKLPEKCPHGRPAVVAITQKDIEKLFKRIV